MREPISIYHEFEMKRAVIQRGKGTDMKKGVGLVLLLIGTLSFFCWAGKKQVWFCDEIYTYESANGFEQDWPSACVDQWIQGMMWRLSLPPTGTGCR